jgi:hypothetical protein
VKKYWSCSNLADAIRGTPKLDSGTREDWEDWSAKAKSAHPIRYWIAEEGLDKIQTIIRWPVDVMYSIKYYVANRWVTKTHTLTSTLPRGQWHELDTRLLHCMFDELVNFVEVDLAWKHLVWEGEEERRKYRAPWYAFGWGRTRTWRCPEAGLAHLDWEAELNCDESCGYSVDHADYGKPTSQALAAKEIKELYLWWKNVYPNRPDQYDTSGWYDVCDEVDVFRSNHTPEQREQIDKSLDKAHEIERQYDEEDAAMMKRLIDVRLNLWT